MDELAIALRNVNLNKSPGPDGVYGQMLEHLGIRSRQRLLEVINQSWTLGSLPKDWKKAIVIPIKKPNGEDGSTGNFRPISLTCISCKIMERMILERLMYFLDSRELLPREQYGFRRGHGTIDQVLYFSQRVRDAQNAKPTNHTIAAFLDLSKAFDRVWKHKLISKLHEHFGIRGNALAWIYDFLRDRCIRVDYKGTHSQSYKLSQGVPQGSVLSPTLFALYLTGIEKVISRGCEIGIFADDIVIWCVGNDLKEMENNLNFNLSDLWKFSESHKISFNSSKSTTSIFTTNRHLFKYQPSVFMNGQKLLTERHPRYLGYVLDTEITSNRHIENLVLKSRRRLNLLKFISGRDWGADASTLRTTYISLVRPIIEYGFPLYCCASETNLQKLERVQLSAARLIMGLRNSCPSEIALFEADLQPLGLRRNSMLVKYYNKLYSYGEQHRTSSAFSKWKSNQRLKKNSPLSYTTSRDIVSHSVEQHILKRCIDPSVGLPNVYFHSELMSRANKISHHPDYLRQLALEVINRIPQNATQIYTDGSKDEYSHSGSGVFIKTRNESIEIKRRNPDFCSVFRSELIAIDEGLQRISSDVDSSEIWILTDSCSSVQYLRRWNAVCCRIGRSILLKLRELSARREVHIQWIPSHVGVYGNEVADNLAKLGCSDLFCSSPPLTFSELFSIQKIKDKKSWLNPPVHDWYKAKHPGGYLELKCERGVQSAISRLASGHLKAITYESGHKVFPICGKCRNAQASPEHIFTCLGLSVNTLYDCPLEIFCSLKQHDLMDLI